MSTITEDLHSLSTQVSELVLKIEQQEDAEAANSPTFHTLNSINRHVTEARQQIRLALKLSGELP